MQPARPPAQPAPPAGGNPYDSAVTGSYPYPGQAGFQARSPQAPAAPGANGAPGPNGHDVRHRRPEPPDEDRGTGAGYGAHRDGRY